MSCGMVRKVDELGRVVIPKEMRRVLNIKTGSSIEIFINDSGEITLKKFSELNNISSFAESFLDIIYQNYNLPCLMCDDEKVILCKGVSKKDYIDKLINIKSREDVYFTEKKIIENQDDTYLYSYIFKIKSEGFDCGFLILLANDKLDECPLSSMKLLCDFLSSLLRF